MNHVTPVRGIPGYESLARLRLRSDQLLWRVISVSTLLHIAAGSVFFGVEPSSTAAEFFGSWQIFATTAYYGLTTGLLVFLTLNTGRWLRLTMIRPLSKIDPDIESLSIHLEPRMGHLFLITVATVLLFTWFVRMLLISTTNIDLLDFDMFLSQGSGVVFAFYVALPIQVVVIGVALTVGVFSATHYIQTVAQNIRVDILRINDYTSVTIVPITIFCTMSILMSLTLLLSTTAETDVFRDILFTATATLVAGGILVTAYTALPINSLARRIRREIDNEIARVLAVIDGYDPNALQDARLPLLKQPDNIELVTYLGILRNMSPWPIGSQVQKIVLFGLLPPLTWFLSATVENLIY